jgi:hypothetical protein
MYAPYIIKDNTGMNHLEEKFAIFSSLLTIRGSFAKNLNLLAQKEKNIFYTRDPT